LPSIHDLSAHLIETCRRVEYEVVDHDTKTAEYFARTNAIRHAHTVRELLSIQRPSLRILNASGAGIGHQDFAITRVLRELGIAHEWTTLDSGRSPYLERPAFQKFLRETGVRLRFVDYTLASPLAAVAGEFDLVLFTEIAEHLDHSALLRSLSSLRTVIAPEGRLILTTPNLLALGNRLRFLLGVGDRPFWGDGQANLDAALFGHIVNYDARRLHRLLLDSGFRVERSYTFDYEPESGSLLKRVMWPALKRLIPNSRGTIFLSATRCAPDPIPFVF
jgi:2-polyprenyl-3-methyl-5-hydroxy-6-metoxy-1,4-benzoquinol methylase